MESAAAFTFPSRQFRCRSGPDDKSSAWKLVASTRCSGRPLQPTSTQPPPLAMLNLARARFSNQEHKDAVRGRNVRRSHAKMRKTLEPQARSASTRFTKSPSFGGEPPNPSAIPSTRHCRTSVVAESAPCRASRRAAQGTRRTRHFEAPLSRSFGRNSERPEADQTNVLPPSALQRRSKTSAVSVCYHLRTVRDSNPRQPD